MRLRLRDPPVKYNTAATGAAATEVTATRSLACSKRLFLLFHVFTFLLFHWSSNTPPQITPPTTDPSPQTPDPTDASLLLRPTPPPQSRKQTSRQSKESSSASTAPDRFPESKTQPATPAPSRQIRNRTPDA